MPEYRYAPPSRPVPFHPLTRVSVPGKEPVPEAVKPDPAPKPAEKPAPKPGKSKR